MKKLDRVKRSLEVKKLDYIQFQFRFLFNQNVHFRRSSQTGEKQNTLPNKDIDSNKIFMPSWFKSLYYPESIYSVLLFSNIEWNFSGNEQR